jgi:excisionase family DNA binding protein
MKLYTIAEVAAITKLSQRTIRREIAKGNLLATRLTTRVRIEETNLLNWKNKKK